MYEKLFSALAKIEQNFTSNQKQTDIASFFNKIYQEFYDSIIISLLEFIVIHRISCPAKFIWYKDRNKQHNWNIMESEMKHHKPNPNFISRSMVHTNIIFSFFQSKYYR
jgi:hypothetical protein